MTVYSTDKSLAALIPDCAPLLELNSWGIFHQLIVDELLLPPHQASRKFLNFYSGLFHSSNPAQSFRSQEVSISQLYGLYRKPK